MEPDTGLGLVHKVRVLDSGGVPEPFGIGQICLRAICGP